MQIQDTLSLLSPWVAAFGSGAVGAGFGGVFAWRDNMTRWAALSTIGSLLMFVFIFTLRNIGLSGTLDFLVLVGWLSGTAASMYLVNNARKR